MHELYRNPYLESVPELVDMDRCIQHVSEEDYTSAGGNDFDQMFLVSDSAPFTFSDNKNKNCHSATHY